MAKYPELANHAMIVYSFGKTFHVTGWKTGYILAPENLQTALRIGGRLFVVVGNSPVMEALLVTRIGESEWSTASLFETDLPRLRR